MPKKQDKTLLYVATVVFLIGVGLLIYNALQPTAVNDLKDENITPSVSSKAENQKPAPSFEDEMTAIDDVDTTIKVNVDRTNEGNYIRWDAIGDHDIVAYEILRKADNETDFSVIGTLELDGGDYGPYTWNNSAIEEGKTYEYAIRVVK